MKFIAVRINADPRTKKEDRYSKYPSIEEYQSVWNKKAQNGFHECVNFKKYGKKIMGYLPPTGRKNIPDGYFGIVFLTPKTKTPKGLNDQIIGVQINCKYLGEYRERNNVPDKLKNFLKKKNALTYNYIAPFEDSILFETPIGGASEILVPADENNGKVWSRTAIRQISEGNILHAIKTIGNNLTVADKKRWKALLQKVQLEATLESVEKEYENDVEKALDRDASNPKGCVHPQKINISTSTFVRDPDVVAAVLKRADGKCENCKNKAPFFRKKDGTPYLEVHHKVQLKDGGADTIDNAIALCPNCHRKMHYGDSRVVDLSKVAVAIISNDVDYEQIHNHKDLLDDVKECLKRRVPLKFRKGQNKKWSQVEYLVVFTFYDEDVYGEPARIDGFNIYKIIRIGDKIELCLTDVDFPYSSLEKSFCDCLDVDEFRSQLQDEAINVYLLEEIMPLT